MSPRLYIAGCLERREEAYALAEIAGARGFLVTSHWHSTPATRESESTMSADERRAIATANHRALERATCVVWLADPRSRGALVEVTRAVYHLAIPVVCVGQLTTPMLDVPGITCVETTEDALDALAAWSGAQP